MDSVVLYQIACPTSKRNNHKDQNVGAYSMRQQVDVIATLTLENNLRVKSLGGKFDASFTSQARILFEKKFFLSSIGFTGNPRGFYKMLLEEKK